MGYSMGLNELLLILFDILFVSLWFYGKYIAIRSLYNQKYQDKIDYLKSNIIYYPVWKYMNMMQIAFRFLLQGKIR